MNVIKTLRKIIHPNFLPVAIYKDDYPIAEACTYVLYGTTNDGKSYISLPLEFYDEPVNDNPYFFIEEPLSVIYSSFIGEKDILENFMFQKLYSLWECMDELYHYSDFPKLKRRLNEEGEIPNFLGMFFL